MPITGHSRSFVRSAWLGALLVAGVAAMPAAAPGQTSVEIKSSLNPSDVLQPVTFTARMFGQASTFPSGSVSFGDGSTWQVTVDLTMGQSIAAGDRHTCALLANGGISCWGHNRYGQAGNTTNNGTDTANPTPAAVAGLSNMKAITAGSLHTCALTSSGGAKCWGLNSFGQLGVVPFTSTNPTPVNVSDLSGAVAIAAGTYHTCALTEAGGVKCWGYNALGQLGRSTGAGTATPLPVGSVPGVLNATGIATGDYHTCALKADGGVGCWGYNLYGQLGRGTNVGTETPNPPPADVAGLSGAVAIAAGNNHTCAVMSDGKVKCWGLNNKGQLGSVTNAGTTIPNVTPAEVTGVTGVVALALGDDHSCALTSTGSIKCWGANSKGQLGWSSNFVDQTIAGQAGSGTSLAITANGTHSCALTASTLSCWGGNLYGQLGNTTNNGTNTGTITFLPVTGLTTSLVAKTSWATLTKELLEVGDYAITANYNVDGSSASLTQTVRALNQSVVFITSPPQDPYVGVIYSPSATASSGLTPVLGASGSCSYFSSTGFVVFIAAGSCTVTAGQPGNAQYNAAPDASQQINVAKSTPSVTLDSSSSMFSVGQPGTFTATITGGVFNAPSGVVTFNFGDGTPAEQVAVTSGTAVASHSYSDHGVYSVVASYGGDDNLNSPDPKVISQAVSRVTQTVSFSTSAPGAPKVGDTYTPAASATSGLAASIGASGGCSLATGQVKFTAAGSCIVSADQAGNTTYAAASQVNQSISVGKATPTLAASAAATVMPGQAVSVTAQITAPAGITPGGSVFFKEGTKRLAIGAVSANQAAGHIPGLKIGEHVITVEYQGDANLAPASTTTRIKVSAARGPEFKINVETAGAQQYPSIAKTKNGYVVVWASRDQDGSGYGVYGQRYNANGVALGATDLPISTTTTGNQTMPKVAGLTSGKFVAVWQSDGQDGSGMGIYARSFTAAGAGSAEFKVNKTSAGAQTQPAIAALEDGGFVVVWTSDRQDGSSTGIYAQRYNAAAKAVGVEFKVNTTTSGAQSAPAVAGLDGGGFVVMWQSADANGLGIFGQRYSATGVVAGKQFAVNKTTADDQSLPSVAGLSGGGFVAAWQSDVQDGDGLGVFARRFDANGKAAGNDLRVNTTTADDQWQPQVSAFGDGGYVVVWTSQGQDGAGKGVYAQVYDAAGAKADVEFLVNTRTAKDQWQPAVAAGAAGNFTAVWTSRDQDGSLEGVYGQRFQMPMGD